jgi:exodeoxyribonuclease VIII
MNDNVTAGTQTPDPLKVVVVDLETLDIRPTAAIIAIGAVCFDPTGGDPTMSVFKASIDLGDAVRYGSVDGHTVAWWMLQSDATRALFKEKGVKLHEALLSFYEWFPPGTQIYGYGADFDCVILGHAYRAFDMPQPWTYKNQRCLRTLTALAPSVPLVKAVTPHDALADAVAEAGHLIKLYKHFNLV